MLIQAKSHTGTKAQSAKTGGSKDQSQPPVSSRPEAESRRAGIHTDKRIKRSKIKTLGIWNWEESVVILSGTQWSEESHSSRSFDPGSFDPFS